MKHSIRFIVIFLCLITLLNISTMGSQGNYESEKNTQAKFSLTWELAAKKFGWCYGFDIKKDLRVNPPFASTNKLDKKEKSLRIIGYYSGDLFDEPLENLQANKLTHVMYAFLIPSSDGTCLPFSEPQKVHNLVSYAHQNECKVYVAIGGWSYNNTPLANTFEAIASDENIRKKFVESIMSVVTEYDFDGAELDWEYPTKESMTRYESLVLELAAELKKENKNLTAALNGAWSATEGPEVSEFVSQACLDAFEFINVMCYDINNDQHSPFWFANTSIDYWLNRNVPAQKIILGIPLYARPTWMQYRHIVSENPQAAFSDSATINGVISHYNGLPTLCKKAILAAYKAGGVMLFDVNEDTNDKYSVVSMIDSIINQIDESEKIPEEIIDFLNQYTTTDDLLKITEQEKYKKF